MLPQSSVSMDRRSLLTTIASAAVGAALAPRMFAQHRDWSGKNPTRYPDPDLIVLDDRCKKYFIGNTPILRLHTGTLWAEGCAWSGPGKYLVWSDIPNDRQLRWLNEDGHVSVFRKPSGFSNGNTFDYQGRQISFEHGNRRVVRYENDHKITVLADKYNGKPLNAPNDGIVHPDGSIWFTDPGYGILLDYEGHKADLELKEAIYRIDPTTTKVEKVADDIYKPNGICFSPDYKKLYVADTGASHYKEAPKNIKVWDVINGKKLNNGREFTSMELELKVDEPVVQEVGGVKVLTKKVKKAGFADGIRCDVEGNVWASAGWVGHGYDGVHVFAPDGVRIGQILLPEICGNVCFGGPKRNRLFMAASQSLYAVYVETRGAHIT